MLTAAELKTKIKNLKSSIRASGQTAAKRAKLSIQMTNMQIELDKKNKQAQSVKKKSKIAPDKLSKAVSLAQKYRKKQGGVPTGKKDVLNDAKKPALPIGKRTSAKGTTYYEYLEKRADRNPKRYPKLAEGGSLEIEEQDNLAMLGSELKSIMHHASELKTILSNDIEIEAWILGKIERAATDLSDIAHYQDGLIDN